MIEHTEFLIGGRMTAPSTDDVINVISPHSEQPIGRTPAGAPRDIDAAVAAARAAMEGDWGATSAAERADLMGRLLVECRSRAEELGFAQVSEMGCPVSQVQPVMVQPSFGVLDYYRSLATETVFEERRVGIGGTSVVRRKPVGVVGAIVPWNGPPMLTMMKLAPALAAGCATVLKPAPQAPLTAYVLAEAALAAGLPSGVVNIVPGGRELGEYLVTHPGVDKISFTGSDAVGKRIASVCGTLMRPVTLELGGKSAAIILEDANLEQTVAGLAFNSFVNSGDRKSV